MSQTRIINKFAQIHFLNTMKKKEDVTKEKVNSLTGLKKDGKSVKKNLHIKPTWMCPICSQSVEDNFCPSCGQKAILPNFCPVCQIECKTQFCGKCGTVVFIENMDANKYLYLSSSKTERQLTKLINQVENNSVEQVFVFLELVLKVLNEIREEVNSLSNLYVKAVNKFSSVDSKIYSLEGVLETLQEEFSDKLIDHQNNTNITLQSIKETINSLTNKSEQMNSNFKEEVAHVKNEIYELIQLSYTIEGDCKDIKKYCRI